MGLRGCNPNGDLDNSKFSEPLPWIGVYIAAASMAISLLMLIDTFRGFRRRNLWFPCKWFSLNATSLTLLSIAAKLPVDLNTSMPNRRDQLTKLSGTVLICTAMANFMISLAEMDGSEMLSNIIALGIFVITVIVNIGIQVGTGVIYVFLPEHAIIMLCMLILLVILVSSTLAVPCAKELLEEKYTENYQLVVTEQSSIHDKSADEKLTKAVKNNYIMALSTDPQYVLGHLVTSTTSGAFSLLSALTLLEAIARSLISGSLDFCHGDSDYKWSSLFVLISQVIAIGIATIAPAIRWFSAISSRRLETLEVDMYWTQMLQEWMEIAFLRKTKSKGCGAIFEFSKILLIFVSAILQIGVVLICKFIHLASTLPTICLGRLFFCCCKDHQRESESSMRPLSWRIDVEKRRWEETHTSRWETQCMPYFVPHFEGEEDLVRYTVQVSCLQVRRWIRLGRKNQPTHLINLLQESTLLKDFKGLPEFDCNNIPQIAERPPNCWAFPVVTLTTIALALPSIPGERIKQLQDAVNEGLRYVRFIEERLDVEDSESQGSDNVNGKTRKVREAANVVWSVVYYYNRWLNEDLDKYVNEGERVKKIIEKLVDVAEKCVLDFGTELTEAKLDKRLADALAANSMHRIAQTILMDYENKFRTADSLFQWLQTAIADVMGACLTNLPRAMIKGCHGNPIETRLKRAREAACLLGEIETILNTLGGIEFPSLPSSKQADIDEWRRCNFN